MYSGTLVLTKEEKGVLAHIFQINGCSVNQTRGLLSLFDHLEKHKGTPFLVSYLKAIKSYILNDKVKPAVLPFSVSQKGIPKGHIGHLYKMAKSSRTGLRKALRILNVHGRWKADNISAKDYKEYISSIAKEPKAHCLKPYAPFKSFKDPNLKFLPTLAEFGVFDKLPSGGGTSYLMGGKVKATRQVTASEHLDAMRDAPDLLFNYASLVDAMSGNVRPFHFWQRLNAAGHVSNMPKMPIRTGKNVLGVINCLTKDGSLKKRFIANAAKGWQIALSPIQNILQEYIRQYVPICVTFDQSEGIRRIIKWASEGKKIWSIDLTSATDNIPTMVYINMVDKYFQSIDNIDVQESWELYKDIKQCAFKVPKVDDLAFQNTGQFMGLLPSKSELDHTVSMIATKAGGNSNNCAVNGDDFVTCEPKVAHRFTAIMKWLGVPIAKAKCIRASSLGEFSGKIADKHGQLPVFKGRASSFVDDPLGYVRQYGFKAINRILPDDIKAPVAMAALLFPLEHSGFKHNVIHPDVKSELDSKLPAFTKWFEQLNEHHSHIPTQGWSEAAVRDLFKQYRITHVKHKDGKSEMVTKHLHSYSYFGDPIQRAMENSRYLYAEPEVRLNQLIDHLNSSSKVLLSSDDTFILPSHSIRKETLYSFNLPIDIVVRAFNEDIDESNDLSVFLYSFCDKHKGLQAEIRSKSWDIRMISSIRRIFKVYMTANYSIANPKHLNSLI